MVSYTSQHFFKVRKITAEDFAKFVSYRRAVNDFVFSPGIVVFLSKNVLVTQYKRLTSQQQKSPHGNQSSGLKNSKIWVTNILEKVSQPERAFYPHYPLADQISPKNIFTTHAKTLTR